MNMTNMKNEHFQPSAIIVNLKFAENDKMSCRYFLLLLVRIWYLHPSGHLPAVCINHSDRAAPKRSPGVPGHLCLDDKLHPKHPPQPPPASPLLPKCPGSRRSASCSRPAACWGRPGPAPVSAMRMGWFHWPRCASPAPS